VPADSTRGSNPLRHNKWFSARGIGTAVTSGDKRLRVETVPTSDRQQSVPIGVDRSGKSEGKKQGNLGNTKTKWKLS
jgi:hypothetical protein